MEIFIFCVLQTEILKMLKDRHFTVNSCQIVNFCDTVEHFFEKIALKIKKYQFFLINFLTKDMLIFQK